jgi:hypothetical protein
LTNDIIQEEFKPTVQQAFPKSAILTGMSHSSLTGSGLVALAFPPLNRYAKYM